MQFWSYPCNSVSCIYNGSQLGAIITGPGAFPQNVTLRIILTYIRMYKGVLSSGSFFTVVIVHIGFNCYAKWTGHFVAPGKCYL